MIFYMNRPVFATVDEQGKLVFPPEIAERFGLEPGSQVEIIEGCNTITLRRQIHALRRVYIEPTNWCNLNCITCMRNVWGEPYGYISQATFARILESLKKFTPLPTVFFGGWGEPLFHPQIMDMVSSVKALGGQVEMITNATLLDEKAAQQLIASKLDMLWISIDGAAPESYADVRLGNALPQVIENVKKLRSLRDIIYQRYPQIGISFVAMRRNINELPAVIRLGTELGAKKFSISNVLPHTPQLKSEILFKESLYRSGKSMYDRMPQITLPRIDLSPETITALEKLLHFNFKILLGDLAIEPPTETCPFLNRNSLSIRWDGAVSPCLPLLHTHKSYLDDRVRLSRAYVMGSVLEKDILEIWNDPEYVSFRERLQAFSFSPCTVCNSCELADENSEDCFGNLAPTCGGCLWGQGFIQCP